MLAAKRSIGRLNENQIALIREKCVKSQMDFTLSPDLERLDNKQIQGIVATINETASQISRKLGFKENMPNILTAILDENPEERSAESSFSMEIKYR